MTACRCRWYIMATGCLSLPKEPDIDGADRFAGEVYYTSSWPHEGVDFSGKRVAVIGTGSSGIQSIPLIAEQAVPALRVPAHAELLDAGLQRPGAGGPPEQLAEDREAYREAAKRSMAGTGVDPAGDRRHAVGGGAAAPVREAWEEGELLAFAARSPTCSTNREANETHRRDVPRRRSARSSTTPRRPRRCARRPPDHAPSGRASTPTTTPRSTSPTSASSTCASTPITTITEKGIDTIDESFEVDAIVYATGFDAMTGAMVSVDVTGRHGLTLKRKWAHGPHTYLGLMTVGFPNLFMITGPGSPSVLSNMAVSIEQHVDWVADCLDHLRDQGFERIEPTPTAETGWVQHVNDCADITLYPVANSWYMGANVPGKPRCSCPTSAASTCTGRRARRWSSAATSGSSLGPGGTQCNDGVIRRLQPDVFAVLNAMAGSTCR